MSLLTNGLGASGLFVDAKFVSEGSGIYNPGVREEFRGSYSQLSDENAVLKFLKQPVGKYRRFSPEQINAYADATVRLAAAVSATKADCRIAPLRGAARPCMLVEVMSKGAVRFEFLDFRDGSKGQRDAEIINALGAMLRRKDPGRDLYRIQVVDTAIGGHGIEKLVRLLLLIHRDRPAFNKQSWILDLHLLHAPRKDEHIDRISAVGRLSAEKVKIFLERYQVPKLIAEDYTESVGFEIEEAPDGCSLKPKTVGGRFLIESKDETRVIESTDLSRTFQEFLCESVTDSLINDRSRKLVRVVWRDE